MKYLDVAVADAVNERLDRMESIVEVIRLTPDEMSMGTAKGCLAVLSELLSETKIDMDHPPFQWAQNFIVN